MVEAVCKLCIHFRQHYIIDEQRCTPVNCGHCSFPRLKRRIPGTPACKHFTPRDEPPSLPDRNGVINFLTKDMLRHILELELPPEVVEDTQDIRTVGEGF